MLIARTATGVMILGLSEENITRLKEGQPILKSLGQFGGTDDVLIVYDATNDGLLNQLKGAFGELPPVESEPKLDS